MNTADLGELQISLPEYNLLNFFLNTKNCPKDALVLQKNLSSTSEGAMVQYLFWSIYHLPTPLEADALYSDLHGQLFSGGICPEGGSIKSKRQPS